MTMKLNLSFPQHGSQKLIELDDEKKTRLFYDRRIAEEVPADALGDEWKGYVLKITGGNDKQGFAMKQGVLLNHRTRLLLDGNSTGFHPWKRPGHRKRKSVRGCIIGPDIAVINAIIIKKGDQDLPGLTNPDSVRPSLRGPKRANNIRKLWGLTKKDDVRQFVSRKKIKDDKKGKPRFKSPKIQRLITPVMIHRKKHRLALKIKRREKAKQDASEYSQLLANIRREKRKSLIEKRRAQSERKTKRLSERKSERAGEEKEKPTKQQKTKEKPEKTKPEKAKKTKKDQPGSEQKAKKQKKDTTPSEETSETKSKGGKAKQQKAEPKKAEPKKEQQPPKGGKKETEKPQKGGAKPTEKPAATEKPAPAKTQKPAAEKPTEKPAGEQKATAKPAATKPAGEKPAPAKTAEKPAEQKPAPEKKAPPEKKPAAEKPAEQKPAPAKQPPPEKRPPEGGEKGGNKKPKK